MSDARIHVSHEDQLESQASSPSARVILLGASNLTRGIGRVVHWTQRLLGGPLDLHLALGHGRSYGERSRVLGRELPGIAQSQIWRDLDALPAVPTYGLLTDIGNDVLYRFPVEHIVGWLEDALSRLARLGAKLAIVQLPTHNVRAASDLQFWLLNHVLFPGRNLRRSEVERDALALAAEIERMAQRYGATLVEHVSTWFGLDPIHYRRSMWDEAWPTILGGWTAEGDVRRCANLCAALPGNALYLRTLTPQKRRLFGIEHGREQPVGNLADGSRIFLY